MPTSDLMAALFSSYSGFWGWPVNNWLLIDCQWEWTLHHQLLDFFPMYSYFQSAASFWVLLSSFIRAGPEQPLVKSNLSPLLKWWLSKYSALWNLCALASSNMNISQPCVLQIALPVLLAVTSLASDSFLSHVHRSLLSQRLKGIPLEISGVLSLWSPVSSVLHFEKSGSTDIPQSLIFISSIQQD